MAKTTIESVKGALFRRTQVSEYPFPGHESARIGVRLLLDGEIDGCRARAAKHVETKRVSVVIDPDFFDAALRREIVAACCFEPGTNTGDEPAYAFGSSDDVAKLDQQTVRALHNLYLLHCEAMEPYRSGDAEEVNALVDALGKSPQNAEGLSMFDAQTLRRFVLTMARVVRETSTTSK